ncbi:MAG: DegT/DnrJ/EryC1/StrS family aminotransferase [Candidatus Omnitrophica bacterium]|nr:DegT/DnrJ/EryC1/StrS family aminotransferase [Candidatus Omnitrophota bacterium]MBU1630376.1 DegT/DnrJ/EryC1/StrS family aminotransferase [Candidatus Omnitrophota bacterium]MBU1889023.1 DegT/DnrJ/EryC1/StrS family aminotransferase [Candidatus Omnitrophota bacterium]
MTIPLTDLKKQYQSIKKEIDLAIEQVVTNTNFILGREVEEFEKEMANYLNTKFAIGVASGTDALVLAIRTLNISEGDEVITTPFTFIATTEAIIRAGAKPVFCDIDEETYNIDTNKIEEKITSKTKAILPVHLYGLSCEMDKILSLAQKYNLKVIEDAAQSFGSEYKDKKAGAIGDIGCFSFFPAKNLGAYGDGGMITTNDEQTIQKLKFLRNHGQTEQYHYTLHGFNSRLDTLQAAVLKIKLKYIEKWITMRLEKARLYNKLFLGSEIITPFIPAYSEHSFNYYTIRIKEKRDVVLTRLKENGIACAIYYPLCLHLQEVHNDLGYKIGDFPVAEKIQTEVLSLPMYPELEKEEIEEIVKIVKSQI